MANETEIERLVVRLTGDNQAYVGVLNDSVQESIAAVQAIESAVNEAASMGQLFEENSGLAQAGAVAVEAYGQAIVGLTQQLDAGEISQEQFDETTKALEDSLHRTNQTVEDAQKAAEGYGDQLREVASTMQMAGGVITAIFAGLAYTSVRAFTEQEDADASLRAALESNGRAVNTLFADYSQFAGKLQETTIYADEQTIHMLQLAESYGVTGEAAKRAVVNAIALGAATGRNAIGLLRMTVALEQGHSEMLMRYIPALRGIKDEAERNIKAQDALSKMFGVATEQAKTTSGALTQMKNQVGELQESFGKAIAATMRPFVDTISEMAQWLGANLPDSVKFATGGLLEFGLVLGVSMTGIASYIKYLGDLTKAWKYMMEVETLAAIWAAIAPVLTQVGMAALFVAKSFLAVLASMAQMIAVGAIVVGTLVGIVYLLEKLGIVSEDTLSNTWLGMKEAFKDFMGDIEEAADTAADATDKVLTDAEKAAKATADHKKEIEAANKSATDYVKTLKLQADTFGMTARQAKIFEAAQQGVEKATIDAMKAEDARLTKLEEAKKAKEEIQKVAQQLTSDVKSYTDSLQSEINTLKGVAEQEKLNALVKRGASEADIERIWLLQQEKAALQEAKKAKEEAEKAEKEHQKLLKEGEKVIEKLLTPMEKYLNRVANAKKMAASGIFGDDKLFSDELLRREIQAAQDELNKETLKLKVKIDFSDNTAVMAGTAEFRKLLEKRMAVEGPTLEAIHQAEVAKKAKDRFEVDHRRQLGNPFGANPGMAAKDKADEKLTTMIDLLSRVATAAETQAGKDTLEVAPLGL